LNAWAEADIIRGKLLTQMQEFLLLLCPVCSVPAFRHGERSWTIDGQQVEYLGAMCYSQWFNLLAAPAAVVPVGRSPEGLPIGVQVVGRPNQDEVVLKVASVIDCAFGYVPPPILT
jgi:Asp-tRNA(Asn)/Glu-tRNA(Gln) amidotransferase A subunit family amidase